ncbi:TonB-dependent receptor plug domain-containing protein [Pelagicoccus mobilis]|uniref:TonB-dependent receptor plug domain-containing protein n=1 Tax=Pelagicoccus mobilis TaxID=415221 RepID=A0A934S0F6_9BACT|nr:TonB-dependent receptor plug domain-containing protein [Pelagicoccus mobilis]MBK1879643.1 TonB-dependent receptor plug domain-containing protein [Pelagicoccus mobilis]
MNDSKDGSRLSRYPGAALFLVPMLAFCSSSALIAQSEEGGEEVFELSPFTIDGSEDQGYRATQTLAGTRMSSELKDVGSAITIMTEEFLEDIGATSFEEALEYAPNTSSYEGGHLTDLEGTSTRSENVYSVRGFTNSSLSRDFFPTLYRPDVYSTERLTFSRGPNSILFGIAQPGGVTNAISKRARRGSSFATISNRIDDEGSERFTIDVNKPLIEDVLAVRFAAMSNNQEYWRDPEWEDSARTYFAGNLRPFGKVDGWLNDLEFHFNYEEGHTDSQRLGGNSPILDRVTPWIEAGRPMVETVGVTTSGNAGEGLTSVNNNRWLISVTNGGVPNLSWRRMAMGARPTQAEGDIKGNRSLLDESIMPFDVNYLGGTRRYTDSFDNTQVILNKKLFEGLHFEAALNSQTYDRNSVEESRSSHLMVDPNVYLPNGDVNPYAGRFYIDGPIVRNQPFSEKTGENQRYSLSYDYDFTESDNVIKHLGRIRAAVSYERSDNDHLLQFVGLHNLTPALTNTTLGLKGPSAFNAKPGNPQNRAKLRHYFNADGTMTAPNPVSELYGYPSKIYFADDPIPTDMADESGVTLGMVADFQGTNSLSVNKSKVAALQWFLLNDKVVGTFGWRKDEQENWNATSRIIADRNPDTWLYPDPRNYDAKYLADGTETDPFAIYEGSTSTAGVVAHPLDWLGVFYNRSDNFVPGGQVLDIFGEPVAFQSGEGEDYGIKLFLMDNKLTASVSFFDTSANNLPSGHVRAGAQGVSNPFNTSTNFLWEEIANLTGDDKYMTLPYYFDQGKWFTPTISNSSTGVEVQMVYNPTKQWRIMFNYSEQEGILSNIGPRMDEYYNEFIPSEWKSEWNDEPLSENKIFAEGEFGPGEIDPATGEPYPEGAVRTLGGLLEAIQKDYQRIQTLDGSSDTRQPLASYNLVTSYSFKQDSMFKGVRVGGTVRWRGDRFLGFPFDDEGGLDTANAYKGGSTLYLDAMLRYGRKLFDSKVDWSIQLNVRNLLGEDDLLPAMTAGDRSDTVVRWNYQTPRSFQLTNTLKF